FWCAIPAVSFILEARRACRHSVKQTTRATVLAALTLCLTAAGAYSDVVKIGMLREGAMTGPIYVAKDRSYRAAEGIDCEIINFDTALPAAVAVVSGDLDVAVTGLSAGFYKL